MIFRKIETKISVVFDQVFVALLFPEYFEKIFWDKERFEFLKYVVTKNWAKKSWKKYQISWCLPGSEG